MMTDGSANLNDRDQWTGINIFIPSATGKKLSLKPDAKFWGFRSSI
jgi:hypothetical protein